MTAQAASPPPLQDIVDALRSPAAYPHAVGKVESIETHISVVLLAGAFAYKLKKPVDLGFVDFSTLPRRHHFCLEEIRINRRLAPGLYLRVVPIVERLGQIHIGGDGELIEYAVCMRRFPANAVLTETALGRETLDRLAEQIAAFHRSLPSADPSTRYGAPRQVLAPMLANLRVLRESPAAPAHRAQLERIGAWTWGEFRRLEGMLIARKVAGWIRECHGDLHRGNIALLDGEPTIFDAIEFNDDLRWIDCISDLAFLAMDLRGIGQLALERRLINAYLERTGDYPGLKLLRFYQVYRAMVRAKVCGIRLAQHPDDESATKQDRQVLSHYLDIAEDYTRAHKKRLYITHGLSGSGKSWLGHALRERLPLIHIRSDIERKRLFGLPFSGGNETAPQTQLYSQSATRLTYQRLHELADTILSGGCSVLVDASFLHTGQRRPFRELADRHDAPFTILSLTAPAEILKARVLARLHQGRDASDANPATLAHQQRTQEPLDPAEEAYALRLDTRSPTEIAGFFQRIAQDEELTPNA